ncbi:MAG: ankyrin repeat domain-containing protein [Gemmatimonadetes bacterium]|nr:ankyrin repeat domain-containing protein [Gemmatimonadota bacterium]
MSDKADWNETLIDAVENGDLAKVYRAVERGADPACITPVHIPPQQETDEHHEIMRYLFSAGTDVNFAGFDEGILMTFSAYRGQLRYLRLYLEAGADINLAQPMNGVTGLHVAVQHNLPDVVRFFLENGANVDQSCHDDAPTPDPGHVYGETALHFAAAGADREVIEILLTHGADRSAKSSRGETPLDYAVRNGRMPNVLQLLK